MWIIIMWKINSKFAGLIGLCFKKCWPLLEESAITNVDIEKKNWFHTILLCNFKKLQTFENKKIIFKIFTVNVHIHIFNLRAQEKCIN